MSTHAIEIVEIGDVVPHPNADKMELTNVWGWQCCVGKGQFSKGEKAVYVPPDYLVPTDRDEFSFLKKEGRAKERISVRRLRGQLSQGLLIKATGRLAESPIGANVMSELGIERWEPPATFDRDQFVGGPSGVYSPKFDVENYQRHSDLFVRGEPVVVTEKLHGANARYVFNQGEFYCGSRTNWMGDYKNPWRMAATRCPQIEAWCMANEGTVVYGEVFGAVQNLRYGSAGDVLFAAFGVLDKQRWLDYDEMGSSLGKHGVPMVPLVYRGPFDPKLIADLAERDSSWPGANHMSEGVVIVPERERRDERVGRVCLKMVSNRYLMS